MKKFKVTMSDGTEKIVLAESKEDAKSKGELQNPKEILDMLVKACKIGRIDIVRTLIKIANIHAISSNGHTPLNTAVKKGDIDIVKLLLKAGADVDEQDHYADMNSGHTPLILASQYGYINIIKLLIDNGANIEAKNYSNMTALKFAIYNENTELIKLLIKSGADTNSVRYPYLPEEVKKAFISAGININDEKVKISNLAIEILELYREQKKDDNGNDFDEDEWDDGVWSMSNELEDKYDDYISKVDKFDWNKEAEKIAEKYINNGYVEDIDTSYTTKG